MRDQRGQVTDLNESSDRGEQRLIATSDLYVGRCWADCNGGKACSALRVDINDCTPLRIRLTTLISNRKENGWNQINMVRLLFTR